MYGSSDVMFDWVPQGMEPISPSVTVSQGEKGQLILNSINKRGFPDGSGAGSDMLKEAAQGIGLSRPTSIQAPNVINPATKAALEQGVSPDATKMGQLLKNTAVKLGGTPSNVRAGIDGINHIWMNVDISY